MAACYFFTSACIYSSKKIFLVPEVAQCYDYLRGMTISNDEATKIEEATRGQGENDLWIVLRIGRITSSRFGEILHRRESTKPRSLVRDFMGYGGPMTDGGRRMKTRHGKST